MFDTDAVDDAVLERTAAALTEREETLAVAESCTGGLLGAALTAVPGSSAYFEAGLTTYAYGAKRRHLAIDRELLDDHGAVSEPVALAMARGVRDICDTTWGVATTGIAGPSGGSGETPVGTVFLAVAHAAPWDTRESFAEARRLELDGDRDRIRAETVNSSLETLLSSIETVGRTE